jgi:dipeptidase E
MSLIFLTSTGLSDDHISKVFAEKTLALKDKPASIIVNAARGGRENKYASLAKEQLSSLRFSNVTLVDVLTDPLGIIDESSVVYVCGGNTFTLMDALRRSGAAEVLVEKITRGSCIYVGVSAGSLVLTPTIRLAAEVEPDDNDLGLTDLAGLQLYPSEVYPHYTSEVEPELKAYEERHQVAVDRISDSQAIIIEDGIATVIGK